MNGNSLKVAILGDCAAGKTSILNRYLFNTFSTRYRPSWGDSYSFQMDDSQGQTIHMNVADIPGGNVFNGIGIRTIEQSDAFVLVYNVDSSKSFQEVVDLREHIFCIKESGVPTIVVGNKVDLPPSSWFRGSRVIPRVLQAAWDTDHVEISAKEDTDMSEIFEQLVCEARKGFRRPSRGMRSAWACNSLSDVLNRMHEREESGTIL